MINIVGFKEYPNYNNLPEGVINVTSRSKTWTKGLSPFNLGPVDLWEGAPSKRSLTVENAWQYSHVYEDQVTLTGDPSPVWFRWAKEGFDSPIARRNPKPDKNKRLYAYWANQKLNKLEARKNIYIPLYSRALVKSEAFCTLVHLYKEKGSLTLWDFDGYDHKLQNLTWKDVINDTSKSLGHAFIIGYLLETGVTL